MSGSPQSESPLNVVNTLICQYEPCAGTDCDRDIDHHLSMMCLNDRIQTGLHVSRSDNDRLCLWRWGVGGVFESGRTHRCTPDSAPLVKSARTARVGAVCQPPIVLLRL